MDQQQIREAYRDPERTRQSLKVLAESLFGAVTQRVDAHQRQAVEALRDLYLQRQLDEVDRQAASNHTSFSSVIEQTLKADVLTLHTEALRGLRGPVRQDWEAAIQSLEDAAGVRQHQELLRRVLRNAPTAFADPDVLTLALQRARQSKSRVITSDDDETVFDPSAETTISGDIDEPFSPDAGLDSIEASEAASERMIHNYARLLFNLVRDRVDSRFHQTIDRVESGFVDSCLKRLSTAVSKGKDPWSLVRQMAVVNPNRLRVTAVAGVDTLTEMQWDDAIRAMADPAGFSSDLHTLRQALLNQRNQFASMRAPQSVSELATSPEPLAPLRDAEAATKRPPEVRESESGVMTTVSQGGLLIVTLRKGEFVEHGEVDALQTELLALAHDDQPRIIVNFASVEHVSSAFLGTIIMLDGKVRQRGGAMRLCEIGEEIMALLRLTRLVRLLAIDDKLDESVRRLTSAVS